MKTAWRKTARAVLGGALMMLAAAAASGCTNSSAGAKPGQIVAVAAENEYGNVLAQIGGRYVSVVSILDNPNADPHSFEFSPSIAQEVASAQLLVQNGLGYDPWIDSIEVAAPSSSRKLILVQQVMGDGVNTPNPHLWYDPRTMPLVAKAMATDLSELQPAHAAYFAANLRKFNASFKSVLHQIARFKAQWPGMQAATTEPVADYLLQAMGIQNVTPWRFQADVMNGVDPSPQDLSFEKNLLSEHQVKVLCYNQQVVSSLTASVVQSAQQAGVPVVGVYETMPAGLDYQNWMLDEVLAIQEAVTKHISTQHLP